MKQKNREEEKENSFIRPSLHLHTYPSFHPLILSHYTLVTFKTQLLSMTKAARVQALHTPPVPSFPESALSLPHTHTPAILNY